MGGALVVIKAWTGVSVTISVDVAVCPTAAARLTASASACSPPMRRSSVNGDDIPMPPVVTLVTSSSGSHARRLDEAQRTASRALAEPSTADDDGCSSMRTPSTKTFRSTPPRKHPGRGPTAVSASRGGPCPRCRNRPIVPFPIP